MSVPIPAVRYRTPLLVLALAIAAGCSNGGKDTDTDPGTGPVDEGPLQFAPIVQWEQLEFQQLPVLYYVPPEPIGLVWGFHGTNGNVGFANRIETVALLNELIVEGFAFVVTESIDQGAENQWITSSTNPNQNADLARLFDLRDELIANTDLTADTPEFAFGFSNGGTMCDVMADASLEAGYDFRAISPHQSAGRSPAVEIPIIWSIAVNDPQPMADNLYEGRQGSGIPSALLKIPEQPVTPDFFTKNPSVSLEQSEQVYAEMVRLEMIDEAGNMLPSAAEAEDWITMFENQADVSSPTLRSDEIRVAWALHRMNSYYAREVRDFFLDTL